MDIILTINNINYTYDISQFLNSFDYCNIFFMEPFMSIKDSTEILFSIYNAASQLNLIIPDNFKSLLNEEIIQKYKMSQKSYSGKTLQFNFKISNYSHQIFNKLYYDEDSEEEDDDEDNEDNENKIWNIEN
jgi:hypothetical protein